MIWDPVCVCVFAVFGPIYSDGILLFGEYRCVTNHPGSRKATNSPTQRGSAVGILSGLSFFQKEFMLNGKRFGNNTPTTTAPL